PGCGRPLVRKPGGKCPECGADVAAHVAAEREREERIERIVAVVSTILVLALFVFSAGLGLVEGVLAYAAAGAAVWAVAKAVSNQQSAVSSRDADGKAPRSRGA
ncbi:MAG: hypothetical protein ACREQ9_02140, partial [Candidatus Binatia bacterium]